MQNARSTATETTDLGFLRSEAQAIRESGALGQSSAVLQLFDFLLDCTLCGRAPKESEIAHAVFTRLAAFNGGEDATVRVYVHRLRRRLADHYLRKPASGGPQIVIPRGEYRLSLVQGQAEPTGVLAVKRLWIAPAVIATLVLLASNAGVAYLVARPTAAEATLADLRHNSFWAPLTDSPRPTSIVVGDYYVFGDRPDKLTVGRLIREFSINSREDLDHQLMANPDFIGHHVDVGLHFTPTSIAPALQRLLPIISPSREDWRRPRTLAMSETTPDRLKLSNIVYVGFFSGLGSLSDPLARASRIGLQSHGDIVVEAKSGRSYTGADSQGSTRGPHEDLAYLAAFPGPNGNRFMIIAGLRDAGLTQAAEIAASPEMLKALAATRPGDAFEALYLVDSIDTTNVGAKLIFSAPLDPARLWSRTPRPQP